MKKHLIKEGIYDNINIQDYHADREYLSSSVIKEFAKSPRHFKHYIDNRDNKERKSHFDFGNVFEIALMDKINGSNLFAEKVKVFDENERPESEKNFNSIQNKEWKEEFFQTDKYIINTTGKESMEDIGLMLKNCMDNKTIVAMLTNTDYQKSLFWTNKDHGIKLKTRPDITKASRNVVMDIKTAIDASPKGFAKDAANFNYPLQSVLQMEGCVETGLMPKVDLYYWIVAEKTAPYNVQVYQFDNEDWVHSQKELDILLYQIKEARNNNQYKGYDINSDNKFGIIPLKLPIWFKN